MDARANAFTVPLNLDLGPAAGLLKTKARIARKHGSWIAVANAADKVRLDSRAGKKTLLDAAVPHLWRYQEFSAWMTDSMHDAGGPALTGSFRQMTALAKLDKLFDSSVAGHRLRWQATGSATICEASPGRRGGLCRPNQETGLHRRRSNESRLERDGLDRSILRFSGVRAPTASVRRDRTDPQCFIPSLHQRSLRRSGTSASTVQPVRGCTPKCKQRQAPAL
jgi:hypothetical protein